MDYGHSYGRNNKIKVTGNHDDASRVELEN